MTSQTSRPSLDAGSRRGERELNRNLHLRVGDALDSGYDDDIFSFHRDNPTGKYVAGADFTGFAVGEQNVPGAECRSGGRYLSPRGRVEFLKTEYRWN